MAQEIESIALSSTTPSVGDTLTYTVTPAEAVTSCLWYRDSVNSANVIGNTASYTVQKADMGHSIICVVTGNHDSNTNPDNPWYGTEQAATEVIEAKIDAEKTIHFRGGSGITIIADGDCEHGEDVKIAKINWDGVALEQEYNGVVPTPKWFRKIKAGQNITLSVNNNDICTISSYQVFQPGTGITISDGIIGNTGIVSVRYHTGSAASGDAISGSTLRQGPLYIGHGLQLRSFGDTVGNNGVGVKTSTQAVITGVSASNNALVFSTSSIQVVDIS